MTNKQIKILLLILAVIFIIGLIFSFLAPIIYAKMILNIVG